MPYKTIIDVFAEELAEIRVLEEQFVSLLPEMMAVTKDTSLLQAFMTYHERTSLFLASFAEMTTVLQIPAEAGQGSVMRVTFEQKLNPLFKECSHHAVDAALIATALKMESYLNAAYLNACVHARMLGLEELCDLLKSRIKANFPSGVKTPEKVARFAPAYAGDTVPEEDPLVNAGLAG